MELNIAVKKKILDLLKIILVNIIPFILFILIGAKLYFIII